MNVLRAAGRSLSDIYSASRLRNQSRFNTVIPILSNRGELNTDDGNRFVFTCKWGWIDMGHFFRNANGAYRRAVGRSAMQNLSNFAEFAQGRELFGADPTSAYAPEDLISNEQGRQFGNFLQTLDEPVLSDYFPNHMYTNAEFANIADEWKRFLRDSGAVIVAGPGLGKNGETVTELIDDDTRSYRTTFPLPRIYSIPEAIRWYRDRSLHKCLCNGDKPWKEDLQFR